MHRIFGYPINTMKEQLHMEPLLKRTAWHRNAQSSAVLNLGVIFWGAWWLASGVAMATDWTQFQGPNMDGTTPDPIALQWDTSSPSFVVWTNLSLTNGFSSFAVSKGRAFTQMSKGSPRLEYCVAVDAATGANLWSVPIDTAPWNPTSTSLRRGRQSPL